MRIVLFTTKVGSLVYIIYHSSKESYRFPEPGSGKEPSGRHEDGGGVFRVNPKTVSFTIVLLGGHLEDLTN